jgi:hypothetical protein
MSYVRQPGVVRWAAWRTAAPRNRRQPQTNGFALSRLHFCSFHHSVSGTLACSARKTAEPAVAINAVVASAGAKWQSPWRHCAMVRLLAPGAMGPAQ